MADVNISCKVMVSTNGNLIGLHIHSYFPFQYHCKFWISGSNTAIKKAQLTYPLRNQKYACLPNKITSSEVNYFTKIQNITIMSIQNVYTYSWQKRT